MLFEYQKLEGVKEMSKAIRSILMSSMLSAGLFSETYDVLYDEEFDKIFDNWLNKNNERSLYDIEAYNSMHKSDGTFGDSERFSGL